MMKKLILALAAILALVSLTAFAEEAAEQKVVLWEHTAKETDEAGNEIEVPVKVTLTYKGELDISELDVDLADGYFGMIRKEGVAPVTIAITPADYGPHANLNQATDEQLQQFIDAVAVQFEEGTYTSEIRKSESGNVYLAVGDGVTRSMWTIYEDTMMEIIQHRDDFSELTEEDLAFALDVGQGIWME